MAGLGGVPTSLAKKEMVKKNNKTQTVSRAVSGKSQSHVSPNADLDPMLSHTDESSPHYNLAVKSIYVNNEPHNVLNHHYNTMADNILVQT